MSQLGRFIPESKSREPFTMTQDESVQLVDSYAQHRNEPSDAGEKGFGGRE
jgi:hypothetical protein